MNTASPVRREPPGSEPGAARSAGLPGTGELCRRGCSTASGRSGKRAWSSESSGLLATAGCRVRGEEFEVSFLNEDGSPDTQAGSHPYECVNNIEFNSHFMRAEANADSR